jgi:CRISPR-associated endonuclease/helicase Cas3
MNNCVLAKPNLSLRDHTMHVTRAAIAIFGTPENNSRIAKKFFKFVRLPKNKIRSFYCTLWAACLAHDLGKANSQFQALLKFLNQPAQIIRHEKLAGIIISSPIFREWINSVNDVDFDIMVNAILNHHLKNHYSDFADPRSFNEKWTVYPEAIQDVLLAAKLFENPVPEMLIQKEWTWEEACKKLKQLRENQHALSQQLRKDPDRQKLRIAVNVALILADGSGSGLYRVGENIETWIHDAFEIPALTSEMVDSKIINPITSKIHGFVDFYDYQKLGESFPYRSMALLPCGLGKYLLGWKFIKGQAIQGDYTRGIYLYQTKGTATEGFRPLFGEDGVNLIHGSSAYEIMRMQASFDGNNDINNTNDGLYSIGHWKDRFHVATVDQYLGFTQCNYQSMCFVPLMADGILVFDEIQSYCNGLFSALLWFLKTFDFPVLLLSGGLPEHRREQLEEYVECFPNKEKRFGGKGLEDLNKAAATPRYTMRVLRNKKHWRGLFKIAKKHLEIDRSLLWIVNHVGRCQSIYDIAKQMGLPAYCFHARFKMNDCIARRNEIISKLNKNEPILVLTTPICESAFDIDGYSLISEYAIVTSLIQRFGRCNRRIHVHNDGRLGHVYLYEPPNIRPYDKIEFNSNCYKFIQSLDRQKNVSQDDLQALLEKYGPQHKEWLAFSSFVEDIWAKSNDTPLRQTDDYSVPAIFHSDLDEYKRLLECKIPVDGLIIPTPFYLVEPFEMQIKGTNGSFTTKGFVTKSNCVYDSEIGLRTS